MAIQSHLPAQPGRHRGLVADSVKIPSVFQRRDWTCLTIPRLGNGGEKPDRTERRLWPDVPPATTADRFSPWRQKLSDGEAQKRARAGGNYPTDGDIHPLRLCEEIKNFQKRDTILCVDGQEILNFGRQSIPTLMPGHRLNSGPFGTMGVGMPFAVGAKAGKPNAPVICLHGDGSFGQNAMELDTAVRHKLPLLVVISLNGGWTADPERNKPGRDLGYTRYDIVAQGRAGIAHLRRRLDRAGVKLVELLEIDQNVVEIATQALLLRRGEFKPRQLRHMAHHLQRDFVLCHRAWKPNMPPPRSQELTILVLACR